MSNNNSIEKDNDLSTTRDADRAVERTSATGTDDKGRVYFSDVSRREDIGESEAAASNLVATNSATNALINGMLAQQARHVEELSVIKQRQLSNSADWDQAVREIKIAKIKDSNQVSHKDDLQATRHGDLAIDRQWNIDEQSANAVLQVTKLAETLGVDSRAVFSTVLASLAEMVKSSASK